jgi:hypothetical protein
MFIEFADKIINSECIQSIKVDLEKGNKKILLELAANGKIIEHSYHSSIPDNPRRFLITCVLSNGDELKEYFYNDAHARNERYIQLMKILKVFQLDGQ